jgi:hypothetical protein
MLVSERWRRKAGEGVDIDEGGGDGGGETESTCSNYDGRTTLHVSTARKDGQRNFISVLR